MTDPSVDLALSVAKPLAAKLAEQLLRPAVALAKLVAEPLLDTFTDRFSEYLARQYAKHSYLPTIVFQVRKPLEELYIPLTVAEDNSLRRDGTGQHFKLERYQPDFLPALHRVLLIDDAGMGKTTASRYLLVQATKNLSTVPVFIELRHLTPDRGIFSILLGELNPPDSDALSLRIDKKQLTRLLEKGIFTFFLDGYDEIAPKHREGVTIDLKAFTDAFAGNRFLITSRPEHALTSFPSFRVFRITPLKKEEAFSLIQKYDGNGDRSQRLIERLNEPAMRGVLEFLKNPLLTTLLYRAYDYKNKIPLKKPIFYRQVFDALYEWHDLTKDGYSTRTKECGLDIDGFHKVLRGLGFVSVLRGRVEADTDEFLRWVREARTYAPELRFSESDFLEDAIKAVPVLRREGASVLWAHKSLAEYFASQFVVQDAKIDQRRVCEHISSSYELSRYSNFLDLLYDTDVAVFNQYFTLPLIAKFKDDCSKLRALYPWLSSSSIERRAAATLSGTFCIYGSLQSPEIFTKQVRQDGILIAKSWGLPTQAEGSSPEQILPPGVGVQFSSSPRHPGAGLSRAVSRALLFLHPLSAVVAVLIEKGHPLILLRSFYPKSSSGAPIVGVTGKKHLVLDEEPTSIWNSKRNFDKTTDALMREMDGVLNPIRVDSVVMEIEATTRQSTTTSSLLDSLSRS